MPHRLASSSAQGLYSTASAGLFKPSRRLFPAEPPGRCLSHPRRAVVPSILPYCSIQTLSSRPQLLFSRIAAVRPACIQPFLSTGAYSSAGWALRKPAAMRFAASAWPGDDSVREALHRAPDRAREAPFYGLSRARSAGRGGGRGGAACRLRTRTGTDPHGRTRTGPLAGSGDAAAGRARAGGRC